MENPYIGLLPPASVSVTVAATRRRDRRSSRPREYLTAREIEKLMDAARNNRWGHRARLRRRVYPVLAPRL